MKRGICTIVLAGLAISPAHAQTKVVASFSVLADVTRSLGGDLVSVTALVGPDGDAHAYQPTPSDAQAVASARVVVANGLGLDSWLERLEHAAGFTGRHVTATDGIDVLSRGGAPDPHAWQDVAQVERYAIMIESALEAVDAPHAETYRARLAAYNASLVALDGWVRDQIDTVPAARRRVVTTHDAFGYFGRAYGVGFRAPVAMSEDSEPSAGAVAALIRQLRSDGTKALFVENMTDPRLLRQLSEEAGAVPSGTLFADALSRPGEGGETYEAMMRHNVTLMVAAMAKNTGK